MLIRLSISGFALIDSMDFEPGMGLNVISGETGAGKSLLIDAIGALIGNRIGKETVRTGSEKAIVEGIFDHVHDVIPESELDELGINPDDDGLLYISREIHLAGRNIVRINGTLLPLSVLKAIGPRLLDIHGQHEQQNIFQVPKHIELLDRYIGERMSLATSDYSAVLSEYKKCLDEISALGTDPQARARRAELLRYQIEELENAGFQPGEEELLLKNKRMIAGIDKARNDVAELDRIFDSEDSVSPLNRFHEAEARIDQLSLFRDKYRSIGDRMKILMTEMESISGDLAILNSDLDNSEFSIREVEERLDLLYRFKNKYGRTTEEIDGYLTRARDELEQITQSDDRLKELHVLRVTLEKNLLEKAMIIRNLRKEAAKDLSEEIVNELSELGMSGSAFGVSLSERPKSRFFSKNGCDEVAFMFTANRGEPEKPLEKIASGGEASRIMLAIKTILAQADDTQSLIFDEIDSGVSGKTSSSVATRMKKLARYKQVLCVTHLAQIAAAADSNFFISKEFRQERTQTVLIPLDAEGKRREVARLLSGETDTQSLNLSEHMISRQENVQDIY